MTRPFPWALSLVRSFIECSHSKTLMLISGGVEYLDRVTLGNGLVIENQTIGVASSFSGFRLEGVDGVLGYCLSAADL